MKFVIELEFRGRLKPPCRSALMPIASPRLPRHEFVQKEVIIIETNGVTELRVRVAVINPRKSSEQVEG